MKSQPQKETQKKNVPHSEAKQQGHHDAAPTAILSPRFRFLDLPPELRGMIHEYALTSSHTCQRVSAFSTCKPYSVIALMCRESAAPGPYDCAHRLYDIDVSEWDGDWEHEMGQREVLLGKGATIDEKSAAAKQHNLAMTNAGIDKMSSSSQPAKQITIPKNRIDHELANHNFSLATDLRFTTTSTHARNGNQSLVATVIFRDVGDNKPELKCSPNTSQTKRDRLHPYVRVFWDLAMRQNGDRKDQMIDFIVGFGQVVQKLALTFDE